MVESVQKVRHRVLSILKASALTPLSFIWEWVYRVRRSFYEYGVLKKHVFKVPVISVGNLSFGGTGKTPTIIWLTEWIIKKARLLWFLPGGIRGSWSTLRDF